MPEPIFATATDHSPAAPGTGAAEIDAPIRLHERVNAEYRLMTLEVPDAISRAARPGQFFHLLCPQGPGLAPFFRRPMSIFRIEPGRISFLYKVTGTGTAALATLKIGDSLNILGPLGIGFSLPKSQAPIAILARGVGLATMAPLVAHARASGHAVTTILSARSPQVLMAMEDFAHDGGALICVTDSEGTSDVAHVEERLAGLHEEGRLGALYVCGSNRLMLAAQRVAARFALFGEVALEQQMACGLGMCFCCVRPFRQGEETVHRRVCCEGPVFDLMEASAW